MHVCLSVYEVAQNFRLSKAITLNPTALPFISPTSHQSHPSFALPQSAAAPCPEAEPTAPGAVTIPYRTGSAWEGPVCGPCGSVPGPVPTGRRTGRRQNTGPLVPGQSWGPSCIHSASVSPDRKK